MRLAATTRYSIQQCHSSSHTSRRRIFSALLQVLYRGGHAAEAMSWVECLRKMRGELLSMGFDQVPQLTSSRMIDVNKTMHIVPPGSTGRRRAILIGINYVGQQGQLTGCHNDVRNIQKYLVKAKGFNEGEMLILMDDGRHHAPTKKNIEDAFRRMTEYSQAGDVVFVHYSGHGGRVRDYSGDEEDGYDETLIPVDFKSVGQIIDDDILKILVKPMRAGGTLRCCVFERCVRDMMNVSRLSLAIFSLYILSLLLFSQLYRPDGQLPLGK